MSNVVLSKIRQVQRRLNGKRFLNLAVWSLTLSFALAAIIAFIDRLAPLPVSLGLVAFFAIVGSVVFAAVGTYLSRQTILDAAVELDRQFGLKERVSTLLALDNSSEDNPAVEALRVDVEKRTSTIRVADRIPLMAPRHGWLPVVPLSAFLAVAFLVGPLDWLGEAKAREATPEERERIVEHAKILEKKLAERQKEAEKQGFGEELKDLAAQVEKATQDLAKNNAVDSQEAVLKLSDLAKTLEERQKELGSVDQMKRSLSKLAETPEGPAREMAKALQQGDLQEAAKAIEDLQKKLKEGKLSSEEQKKLGNQLAQMQEQLQKMSNLSERADQLKKSLPPEMLEKELAKLAQDAEQMKKLKELAEKLGQCSECLKQGEGGKEAEEALQQARAALEKMMQDEKKRQMLEEMLGDMAECRGGMCKNGQGQNGSGKGKGIGRSGGPTDPQAEDTDKETRSRKVRSPSDIRKGAAVVVGKADGGSFRGDSKLEIQDAVRTASDVAEEAISRQKIPRDYQDHTRDYFERLNGQVKE